MPSTRYGVSPWLDAVPAKKRREFPAFRGVIEHPVVVVGGGMSGAMTAFACASAGLKVILLEANRIGLGGSGYASGLLSGDACESYRELEARAGRRAARALFDAMQAAPRELAAVVKRTGIRAGLDVAEQFRVLGSGQLDKLLRREMAARQEAGVKTGWLAPAAVARQAAIDSAGAMRLPDGGFADPFKLTHGFLAAAIKRGARVFEKSAVRKISFTRKTATAFLDGGAITTTNLAICIGEPTTLFKPLKRHLRHEDRYVVMTEPLSAAVRAELGQQAALITDSDAPPHHLWFTADHRAVFAGADQKRPPDRLREKTLVQRTGQLMYELSRIYPAISGVAPAYGWSVPLAHPVDGVLYAGSHRNFPFHHFAFGTSHDPARAFLASRIIVRGMLGRPEKGDEHFSFARNL
ncbi:MAG TPA: FAD-binding oxidoreductase [Vicinamibacterales bacterium]|nr:FAD-binding oxidoreductase [Vicinamibacterales bacterium]